MAPTENSLSVNSTEYIVAILTILDNGSYHEFFQNEFRNSIVAILTILDNGSYLVVWNKLCQTVRRNPDYSG